jgi:hypothetical protein
MAETVEVIKIQYDTDAAVTAINNLSTTIANNTARQKELKSELKNGKISQQEYATQMDETTQSLSRDMFERKKYINIIQSEVGSVKRAKAENQIMREERNKLSTATEEGRKKIEEYNKKIDLNTIAITGNVDKQSQMFMTLGKLKEGFSNLPGPIGGIVSGIGGMTKASLAFIATPIGAVIAAVGLALKALMSYFKGSEEGQNRLNKITNVAKAIWEAFMDVVEKVGEVIFDAISKPKEMIVKLGELIKENLINRFKAFGEIGKAIAKIFKGDFKEGFKQLAEGGVQAVTGVTNAFDKLGNAISKTKEYLKGVGEETAKKIKLANQLSDIQAKADKLERTLIVEKAEKENEISELRLKAAQKDKYSEEQRLAFLKEASGMIDQLATKEEGLATLRLQESKTRLAIEGDTKEALTEVAQKEADLINIRAESLDKRRKIEGQISMLTLKQGDDAITIINNVVETDSKAQDDILERRGKAIADLADLKAQEVIDAETNINKKAELEKADLERRHQVAISDKTLLAEEIAVIDQDFKMQEIERQLAHEEQLKAIRQAALDDARNSMQEVIAAAGEMGDQRVNIALDAFSKLSTINFKEVTNAREGFVAIGTAAQGLTSLITSGNQAQLDDLKMKYDSQIAAAGDNTKRKEKLERDYNKKLVAIKKQQFKEDKAKALVDAGIATALSVAKSLPNIPLAILSGVLGLAQIAIIATKKEPNFSSDNVFATGGAVIGGRPHSQGGTKFYGTDGSKFEAERGEGMYIMKKDAMAEISALSAINESFGGRSWTSGYGSKHLADGGQVDTSSGIDSGSIGRAIQEGMQGVTIITRVADIKTGIEDFDSTVNAGVI